MGKIRTRVAGVTFNNDDGSSRQEILSRMAKHRKLRFHAVPFEDRQAIVVTNVKKEQLGNLPADVCQLILDRGIDPTELKGEVFSIEGRPLGCIIDVEHDSLRDNEIGYRDFRNNGDRPDWEAVRAYVGKTHGEHVTARDVDAYYAHISGRKVEEPVATPPPQRVPRPTVIPPKVTQHFPTTPTYSVPKSQTSTIAKVLTAAIPILLLLALVLFFCFILS